MMIGTASMHHFHPNAGAADPAAIPSIEATMKSGRTFFCIYNLRQDAFEARGSIGIELVETREEEKFRVESDAAVCINCKRFITNITCEKS